METQISRICVIPAIDSGVAAVAVQAKRTSASTRDGCASAMRRAMREPMDIPTKIALGMLSSSCSKG